MVQNQYQYDIRSLRISFSFSRWAQGEIKPLFWALYPAPKCCEEILKKIRGRKGRKESLGQFFFRVAALVKFREKFCYQVERPRNPEPKNHSFEGRIRQWRFMNFKRHDLLARNEWHSQWLMVMLVAYFECSPVKEAVQYYFFIGGSDWGRQGRFVFS